MTDDVGGAGAPSTDAGVVHIASGFDRGYVLPAAVMLSTIGRNLAPDLRCVAHVAAVAVDADARARLEDSAGDRVTIDWVDFDPAWIDALPTPRFSTWSQTVYISLLTDRFVPADVDRFLFIDADTLVNESIGDLVTTDLAGSPVGAVRDFGILVASMTEGIARWRELGMAANDPYFNSGVVVVDRAAWREAEVERRAIEYLEATGDDVFAVDQEALNVVLANRWHPLPLRWNSQVVVEQLLREERGWIYSFLDADEVDAARDDPAIVHFSGAAKPWNDPGVRHGGPWWDALAQTAFRDHRPPEPPARSVVRGGLRRLRRAGATLRSG